MQRNKAIPMDPREYPPFEYKEYPKMLSTTLKHPDDTYIIAEDAEHEAALREQYPDLPPFEINMPPSAQSYAAMEKRLAELEAENAMLKGQPAQPGESSAQGEDPWNDGTGSGQAAEQPAAEEVVEQPDKPNKSKKK